MAHENIEIDVRAWVVRIFRNWHWFVLSTAILGLLGVFNFFSTTYKFDVSSEIMLRGADNGNTFLQPEMLDMLGINGDKKVSDEIVALSSRDIMSRVITDLNLQAEYRKRRGLRWEGSYPNCDIMLATSPEFFETLQQTTEITVKVRKKDYVVLVKLGRKQKRYTTEDITQPLDTWAGIFSFNILNQDKVIKGAQYNIKVFPLPVLVSIYQGRIKVATGKKDSKVITISSTTDVPKREKEFIKRMIDLYNSDAMADKDLVAQTTANFIEERLRVLEDELTQAENAFAQQVEKHGYVKPHTEVELFLSENVEYQKQLSEVETQINIMNYLYEFMTEHAHTEGLLPAIFMFPTYQLQPQDKTAPSGVNVSGLSLLTAVEDYNNLVIQKMRIDSTTTANSKQIEQIDAELAALRGNIIATIKNILNTLVIAKTDLENHFALANEKRSDMPEFLKEYERRARRRTLQEEQYLYICEQREANAMLLSSTIMPIKIIAQSQINPIPVSPHHTTIIFFLIIGLALPLGFMIIYDILNNRISGDPTSLKKRLNMPMIGSLANCKNKEHLVVRDDSIEAESFRDLRTNVRFMQPKDVKCPVILVTSSVNNEGKSYVATNLATSMTLLGKKVALVELDIRQPMLATHLNLPSQGCLTYYLSDMAYTVQDTIVPASIKNLDILPAGVVPPNPSELLQRERIDELFTELREKYDYVIIDSAPIALMSDTFLLGHIADMTICVVRANHTTFDLIDFLNQAKEQQRLPNMAVALNGVDIKKARYGYSSSQTKC